MMADINCRGLGICSMSLQTVFNVLSQAPGYKDKRQNGKLTVRVTVDVFRI